MEKRNGKKNYRKCIDCGKLLIAANDTLYCYDCAQKRIKATTSKKRICKDCGKEIFGGPRLFYCESCRIVRKKENEKRHRENGTSRKLGSIDKCEICGKEYIVKSGRSKYCDDCKRKADLDYKIKHNSENRENNKNKLNEEKIIYRSKRIKVCKYCLKEFPVTGNNSYCSEYCKNEEHKIVQATADLNRGKNANIQKLIDKRNEYREYVQNNTPGG